MLHIFDKYAFPALPVKHTAAHSSHNVRVRILSC